MCDPNRSQAGWSILGGLDSAAIRAMTRFLHLRPQLGPRFREDDEQGRG